MYTWAEFVGVIWLARHAGPSAGLRRGGKESNLGSQLKKPIFCCSHLQFYEYEFLDAFTKLRSATVSFVMSACLSVRPYGKNSSPTGRISMKLGVRIFF
jgi:hypothetical protein